MTSLQLTADISSLSVQGLGAFQSVLATLSADNVVPMAVVQMEKFGSLFNVNGKFAEQTPDLLKRFSAHPLGRLAAVVGWRKGDTASLLAETAGGQAAALLSATLSSLFTKERCGEVLQISSINLLPAHSAVASTAQLADVASLLGNKMGLAGFGTFLSEQVSRINNVYQMLDLKQPDDLLNDLTSDAAANLLCSLSQALREEDSILRVAGTSGMGHILALMLFLCPKDVTVTIDGYVIQEGPLHNIFLEFRASQEGPTFVTLEHKITTTPTSAGYRIEVRSDHRPLKHYRYQWPGWMARNMELMFAEAGLSCTEKDRLDFANLAIACMEVSHSPKFSENPALEPGICIFPRSTLLEPGSWLRMVSTFEEILLITPAKPLSLREAFDNLAASLQQQVDRKGICSCRKRCNFSLGWPTADKESKLSHSFCKASILWDLVGRLVPVALCCFHISAGPGATVSIPSHQKLAIAGTNMQTFVARTLSLESGLDGHYLPFHNAELAREIFAFINPSTKIITGLVAISDGSTAFARVLETLSVQDGPPPFFNLVDGMIIYRDRYHPNISTMGARFKRYFRKPIQEPGSVIIPSSLGEHSDLRMTLRETTDGLDLRASIRCDGTNVNLHLSAIFDIYMTMRRVKPCPHPSDKPFTPTKTPVMATSVASPVAPESTTLSDETRAISVVMTKDNPIAQVLSCEPYFRPLLMENCCLDCAVKEAIKFRYWMIIVA